MAKKYTQAKAGDDRWTADKQQCHELLLEFVGGEHRLGKLTHFGNGLRMTTQMDLATFDSGHLTWLVVLAHKHLCRVAIGTAGPRQLAIQVWAREPDGGLMARHPSLADLAERCERHQNNGAE